MAMMCKKGSYNITEDCGDTLLLTNTDEVYCDSCGFQQENADADEL